MATVAGSSNHFIQFAVTVAVCVISIFMVISNEDA